MPKAKRSHKKKYDYDKNRKKQKRNFLKKYRPKIEDVNIRHAWDNYKTSCKNLQDMGLAFDPNLSLPIKVAAELEEEASQPFEDDKSLSRDLIDYVQHMVGRHMDDYTAMARDEKNYYQDTPKQIRRKVNEYKRCHPAHYAAFLQSIAANANPQSSTLAANANPQSSAAPSFSR
ncbi:hypothetical protein CRUP_038584 [Coryphaenoides rupestris]|nr:hypothetical protein CRUP_038584 [Coryphaenoides rupestris]